MVDSGVIRWQDQHVMVNQELVLLTMQYVSCLGKGEGDREEEKKEGDWGERVRDACFPSLSLLSRFSPSPSPPPLFAPATQAMQYATKTNITLYREFIVKRAVEFNRSQSNNDMA